MLRLDMVFALTVLSVGPGCTFLVSFDDRGDAGAPREDVTTRRDVGSGVQTLEVGPPPDGEQLDVYVSADVADCSTMSDGSPCAKPNACSMTATCMGGVCTPNPLPDLTSCGTASDACHTAPICMGGVCQAEGQVGDGTSCGTASGTCATGMACMSGSCTTVNAADGTSCGAAPDDCHAAPVCKSGACAAAADVKDGTACGKAPDDCHDAPVCKTGKCEAAVALAEGTNWKSGDANARCCSGKAVETTTTSNCGVCGWTCESGQACTEISGEYLCTGCTANSECASKCCSASPAPNHCSPSNCAAECQKPDVCTGGSHCIMGSTIDYCGY